MATADVGNTRMTIYINSRSGSRVEEFKFNLKEGETIKKILSQKIVTTYETVFDSTAETLKVVPNDR